MIVRNVPALGCGDDLMRLFMTYGEVEERLCGVHGCLLDQVSSHH
jgi:hypothetical protein